MDRYDARRVGVGVWVMLTIGLGVDLYVYWKHNR